MACGDNVDFFTFFQDVHDVSFVLKSMSTLLINIEVFPSPCFSCEDILLLGFFRLECQPIGKFLFLKWSIGLTEIGTYLSRINPVSEIYLLGKVHRNSWGCQ